MRDEKKPKAQLIEELVELRQRVGEVEVMETDRKRHETEQAALGRIRDVMWTMKDSDEMNQLLFTIRNELEALEVPFQGCSVNIVEDLEELAILSYQVTSDSVWTKYGPGSSAEFLQQIWRKGVPFYRPDLNEDDPTQEKDRFVESYGHSIHSVIDIPFSLGTLALNSSQANAFSPEHIELLKSIAGVLSEGFQRQEDLLALEQRNRELEAEITERKQAEEAFRENERLLRKIADNYPNSYISIIESDYTVGFTSGQEFTRQNLDPEQFAGLTLEQVFGDKAIIIRPHYEMTFNGEERSFEIFLNNQHQWYRTIPLYSEDGSIPRILAVVENITKRKQAEEALQKAHSELERRVEERTVELQKEITNRQQTEEALRESERRYKALFESAPDIVWLHDLEGTILAANDVGVRKLGYSKETLQSMNLRDIVAPEIAVGEVTQLLIEKKDMVFESVHRRNDGSTYPVEVHGTLMELDGKPVVFSYVRDITERKQVEKALRESEKKYRNLVESIDEGIGMVDEKEDFTFVNQAVSHILGYTKEELIGKNIREWTTPEEFQRILEQTSHRKAGSSDIYEMQAIRKDGAIRDLVVTTSPITDENGKYGGAYGIFRDITERKKTEKTLRESEERNRTLVKESHHRIKNNLQIISSLLELQANHTEDETVLAVLQDSCHRVRSMSLIHERLYQSADLTQIDLADYLRTLTTDLVHSYHMEAGAIALEFQLEGTTLGIDATVSCGLIVNELVTNSLQHAFAADQKGTIGLGLHTNRDNQITLMVWDDGRGIPPEMDFNQAETLGLKLVMSLVRQLKGQIEISGEGGSRFEIVFNRQT